MAEVVKIEYIKSAGERGPTVLLYGRAPDRFARLQEAVRDLASGRSDQVAVETLAGFEGVDGCRLSFSISNRDEGVVAIGEGLSFDCRVRPVWWENIEGLLDPWCSRLEDGTRFQYLDYGLYTPIGLAVASERRW